MDADHYAAAAHVTMRLGIVSGRSPDRLYPWSGNLGAIEGGRWPSAAAWSVGVVPVACAIN